MADRLLKATEAATLLRVTVRTLANWRKRGTGPPVHRVGPQFRYFESEVLDWLRLQPKEEA